MTYEEMWNKYIETNKEAAECDYSAYDYDAADVKKILSGEKNTEVSLYDSYIKESEPLPIKGDYAVISDDSDNAACIVRNKSVELKPFSTAKNKEDLKAEAKELGIEINDETLVVVETFEVIFK